MEESEEAINLALTDESLFATVGCHPTRCSEFLGKEDEYLKDLNDLIIQGLFTPTHPPKSDKFEIFSINSYRILNHYYFVFFFSWI